MAIPTLITSRGFVASDTLDTYIRARAAELTSSRRPIIGCIVTLEALTSEACGRQFSIRVDLALPFGWSATGTPQGPLVVHDDLELAVDLAFEEAAGRLVEAGQLTPSRPPAGPRLAARAPAAVG